MPCLACFPNYPYKITDFIMLTNKYVIKVVIFQQSILFRLLCGKRPYHIYYKLIELIILTF